jgi:hypothetical protein
MEEDVSLPRQQTANTCWAACIQFLQRISVSSTWHQCCVADPTGKPPPCRHPGQRVRAGHDRKLHMRDFAAQARRCGVEAQGVTRTGIERALRSHVVTFLRVGHYEVIVRGVGEQWCVYDPTWHNRVYVTDPSEELRYLKKAWRTPGSVMIPIADTIPQCCSDD